MRTLSRTILANSEDVASIAARDWVVITALSGAASIVLDLNGELLTVIAGDEIQLPKETDRIQFINPAATPATVEFATGPGRLIRRAVKSTFPDPVGVKGRDSAAIATLTNPLPVQDGLRIQSRPGRTYFNVRAERTTAGSSVLFDFALGKKAYLTHVKFSGSNANDAHCRLSLNMGATILCSAYIPPRMVALSALGAVIGSMQNGCANVALNFMHAPIEVNIGPVNFVNSTAAILCDAEVIGYVE